MNRVTRLLWFLVVLGLVFYVGLTLWLATSAIFFPYALDYGEGAVGWFTNKLARGLNIYTTLPGPPLDSSNYPPFAMVLTAALNFLFGDSLLVGRWVSFASALIVAAFVARFVRVETKNLRVGLLCAGLFLGSTFVYHWMPLYRVDLLGVALSLAGVFCVWRWEQQGPVRKGGWSAPFYLLLAVVFFFLALYTKHSLLFAPAAAAVAIFLRDRRAAIYFVLSLGISGGILFILLEMLTRGGWSFSLVALNATVWTPSVFVALITSFLATYAVLLGLAAWGWLKCARAKQVGVLGLYALGSLLSLVLAGREGAWENYFLEAIAMACVFAGVAIVSLRARFISGPQFGWLLPVLLLVQLGLFVNEHDPRIAQKLFDDTRAANEHVSPMIRDAAGTVLAEDVGLVWENGKPVEYNSFPYSTLARAGRYDQKWETENLRAGNFPLVILNQGTRQDVDHIGNFTRAFVSALDYGYAVTSEDARYVLYTPAPLQQFEPTATFGDTFELVGWSLKPDALEGGSELVLTSVWHARAKPMTRYTTFAHLEDASGGKLAQDDHEPQGGEYPTTRWANDELVRDTYRLQLPETIPPGDYTLRVGWYDSNSQDRLSTQTGGDTVELKRLTVR